MTTETKVVRWTRPGTVTALRIKAGRFECRWDHYPNAGDHRWKDCGPVSIAVTDELARLAAELERRKDLYESCLDSLEVEAKENTRLAARVEELESGTAYKLAGEVAAQINQKNEDLQTENTRLREALERRNSIVRELLKHGLGGKAETLARAALKEKP